jgi:sRNA-binding protein
MPKTQFGISRPSQEAATRAATAKAKANTAKITGDEGRLSIRMSRDHVRAIHIAALKAGQSVKSFVLGACRTAGAELPEGNDEEDE